MKTGNQKFVKGTNALMALATKTVKNAEVIITVADQAVAQAMNSYFENKQKMDAAKKAMEASSEIVKEYGTKVWTDEVERTGRPKESFILSNGTQGLLYIVSDAYKSSNLNDETVEHLQNTYGEDIIDHQNKFVLNEELVDKYGQLLCDFISQSPKIADEDRALIIQLEQKVVIRKGTIDKISEIAKKVGTSVASVFAEILPTVSLKVRGK